MTEKQILNPAISIRDPAKQQDILKRCEKQRQIGNRYRFPTFSCPNCGAKNILFAGSVTAKNETELKIFQEGDTADYVIICPKCSKHIGVRRYVGMEHVPAFYRTGGYSTVNVCEVYNYRFLTEKSEDYISALPAFMGAFDDDSIVITIPIHTLAFPSRRK